MIDWNKLLNKPHINQIGQIVDNYSSEYYGMIPITDLEINELFRSVMGDLVINRIVASN